MKVLCTICARGGSKGVPNKNIRNLFGKPVIAHTIELAKRCSRIDRVVVSTDSPQIAEVARSFGAEAPFLRPAELATDTAAKPPAIRHAVNYYIEQCKFTPDLIIDLDPTSPLRELQDIEKCLDLIEKDPDCDSVITGYLSTKNPYFNMVEVNQDGYAELSKRHLVNGVYVYRRQDAPSVYAMNASIYVWRTGILFQQQNIVSGRVRFYEMPHERSVDIDTEIDFNLVELLMKEKTK